MQAAADARKWRVVAIDRAGNVDTVERGLSRVEATAEADAFREVLDEDRAAGFPIQTVDYQAWEDDRI
jgi:hypothetical protein